MRGPLRYSGLPEFKRSSLLIGWDGDAGRLGETVTDYMIRKLDGHLFYEIEPSEYFSLGGVTIEDDIVQFPESKFFACPNHNLIVFKSAPPCFEFYKFFQQVLDISEQSFKAREIYAIGGTVSLNAHTSPRQLFAIFNSHDVTNNLRHLDIDTSTSYETPPGQKPTLNSFLLWASQKRNLQSVDLWVPVPFYLMSVNDPGAQKRILEFLKQLWDLSLDLSEFDEAIKRQNQKINEVRHIHPEIDNFLMRLESNLHLSEDENMKLVKQIEEYLK